MPDASVQSSFPAFDRDFLRSHDGFTVIGSGSLGGKAMGLAFIKQLLGRTCPPNLAPGIELGIPRLTVLATDVFEQFMQTNDLYDVALSDATDERIAHAFEQADLPVLITGDLRALIADVRTPLAVRSSSLLEDALKHPFAGTYATKMIPNNEKTTDARFRCLVEAIKFVWASTFFQDARAYRRMIGSDCRDERMAVVIQETVGRRHNDRFYPTVSGVARTYNFYPTAPARPEDGVVNLALGLGKTIVDGGVSWPYAPPFPRHAPPFGSARELLNNTQTRFWAVNMGAIAKYDPINEAEYLVSCTLEDAELDGTLKYTASTYDPASERLVMGTGRPGPRALTFAPLLELDDVPVNRVIEHVMQVSREAVESDVELEFAVTLDPKRGVPARLGVLQLRPTLVSGERVDVTDEELQSPAAVVASERVLGNGRRDDLIDIVYVRPGTFEARHTPAIAREVQELNRGLLESERHCVLIGFGRWGSSDPWLGIPVTWPQISAARVIVEATLPDMNVDPSQGTHFFHNMTSFAVQYFTVRHDGPHAIRWGWLDALAAERETALVRHVRAPQPLVIKADGRSGRGVILAPRAE